ncbi:cytochrome P450 [Amycolatopsis sp. NPDC059021]|uniref:cytochrome P450 n=1 Tax=Amycolatopsis sp. NPDC059021 TaxID=3346704 RepID=UPI00366ADC64
MSGEMNPIELPAGRTCPFDPPADYARLRREHPVARIRLPDGGPGWLVTRFAQAREILADARFGSSLIQVSPRGREAFTGEELEPPPGNFAALDPPEHTRYRRLVAGEFTVRRMNRLASRIELLVEEHLEALRSRGNTADLVGDFALPLSARVIFELLGVPAARQDAFKKVAFEALSIASDVASQRDAFARLHEDMRELVRAEQAGTADGVLGGLGRADPPLTVEEIANIGVLLLVTGQETTSAMVALSVFALLRHPGQLEALRAEPGLIGDAVEELLRYLSIVQFGLTRIALEDVDFAGHLVRAGERVIVSVASGNRDAAVFADADRLDVRRARSPHLAFGFGVHQCLGAQLARTVLRLTLTALLRRLPGLRLAGSEQDVSLRSDAIIYGVDTLPVAWE